MNITSLLVWVAALVFYSSASLAWCEATSAAGQVAGENSPDPEWNTTLASFRALKHSKVTFSIDPMEARVLDYLLMDSHGVDKDDPTRFPGLSAQALKNDQAIYVFYRENLCLEATELTFAEFDGTRRNLRSKYGRPHSEFHSIGDDFSDSYGKIRTFYHFEAFDENPSTLVYLVRVTGYYENQLYYDKGYDMIATSMGELMKVYLIHVSKSYLQGENAYSDWLADQKNPDTSGTRGDYLQSLKRSIEH